jgi:acyl carrier protein
VGLGRGYLNRPELTAEKFVPHPFGVDAGARLYKTGDLARYLADGNIEFLGRADHQVKLRGFRIELDEIESVLRQHDFVRDSAVITREDDSGDKRLVAYIIARQETEGIINELRAYLKERLPEYMVPSAFVLLEKLPLTSSGKLDRAALPDPEVSRPEIDSLFLEPRSEVEQKIAAIWREALQLEKVGVNDSFFDLGGHSLLMVRVHGLLRASFGRSIPLVELFAHPTISSMATYLSGGEIEAPSFDEIKVRSKKKQEALGRQEYALRRKRNGARVKTGEADAISERMPLEPAAVV